MFQFEADRTFIKDELNTASLRRSEQKKLIVTGSGD